MYIYDDSTAIESHSVECETKLLNAAWQLQATIRCRLLGQRKIVTLLCGHPKGDTQLLNIGTVSFTHTKRSTWLRLQIKVTFLLECPVYAINRTSVFKVFERVSWWSFRVSTPFSLLFLILLTDFHKNSSFRPNMLNYLNTTCTFGKHISWIEMFNVDLHTHSFTQFRAHFSFGESRVDNRSRRTRNTSRSTAISTSQFCWLHTKMGASWELHTKIEPSKVRDVVTSPDPWTNFGPLSDGCKLLSGGLSSAFFPGIFCTHGELT